MVFVIIPAENLAELPVFPLWKFQELVSPVAASHSIPLCTPELRRSRENGELWGSQPLKEPEKSNFTPGPSARRNFLCIACSFSATTCKKC